MQHQAQRPYIDFGSGLHITSKQLRRHKLKATKVDVLHSDTCYRAKYSEINHFKLYFGHVYLTLPVTGWWLGEHHVLKFEISMDNLTTVAIINGI